MAVPKKLPIQRSPGVRRVVSGVFRAAKRCLMVDRGAGLDRTVLVAGTGRSGTTWIGDVVAAATRSRILFEPFLLNHKRDFVFGDGGTLHLPEAAWNLPLHLPPSATHDPRYHVTIGKILAGQVRGRWVDVQPRIGIHRQRVVKDIRANLMLGCMALHWPQVRVLYVVRNPVSVVESMISQNRLGFDFNLDPQEVLADAQLMRCHLQQHRSLIESADDLPSRLALRWCIENLVAQREVGQAPGVLWLSYEAMTREPDRWNSVAEFLPDLDWSNAQANKYIVRRSRTSRRSAADIRAGRTDHASLTAADVRRISNMVRDFGLEALAG